MPGSYSYRLIQDAVKEGSLDIKDDYLCDVLAASSGVTTKPVAKNKLTRIAFTKEDDQILTKYVLEMETEGKSTSGNDIYKEFAKKVNLKTLTIFSHRSGLLFEAHAPYLAIVARPLDQKVEISPSSPNPRQTFTATKGHVRSAQLKCCGSQESSY